MRLRILGLLLVCIALFCSRAVAQNGMSHKTIATTKFGSNPALPACATIAIQDGNPHTSSSVIVLHAASGCVIPWHWHSADERLIVIRGTARFEMKDTPPATLRAGDFAAMPAKHIHRLTVIEPIVLYNIPDGVFDIHYVDAAGKEIPPSEALKP